MARQSINPTIDIDIDGLVHGSDSNVTSEYEFVAVLNLNLVTAGGDADISATAVAGTASIPTVTPDTGSRLPSLLLSELLALTHRQSVQDSD